MVEVRKDVCVDCPIRPVCERVRTPETVLDLSEEQAEQVYYQFDLIRTRYISLIDACRRSNGEDCYMSSENQRRYVENFVNNEDSSF